MQQIETLPHVFEAFQSVQEGLEKKPHAFGICPPLAELRYAKTRFYLREEFSVPPMTFYFTINEDEKTVQVFAVQQDSGFGDLNF